MEQVKTRSKIDIYLSKTYKVVFHNDDYTTFDFVIKCLFQIFGRNMEDAINLTLQIDQIGYGVAGSGYVKDVAETKKKAVLDLAKQYGYPFQVTVEEE